jgi:opacity protein-like surface antigen
MISRVFLVAAAAFVFGAGSPALAQDWTDNVYVSVLGGPTFSPHLTVNGVPQEMDTGFNAGGRVGYKLDDMLPVSGFAVEFDGFYNQSHYTGTPSRMASGSLMGNLVYRFDTGTPFGVYGGAGIGAVQTSFNGQGFDGSSTVLGWQALGGVDYRISDNTSLFTEYRYQNAHAVNLGFANHVGNTSNNVSVGLKFNL